MVKIVFFRHLLKNLNRINREVFQTILGKLEINKSKNPEILCLWYQITLKKGFMDSIKNIEEFLSNNGRIKYLKYVYIDLFNVDKNAALMIYIQNKNKYHQVLNKILESSFERIDSNYKLIIENLKNLLNKKEEGIVTKDDL